MMKLEDRLTLFQDMIACCHNLYVWTYDGSFHLIESNCPAQMSVHNLFSVSCRNGKILEQLESDDKPLIFHNEIGVTWVLIPEFEKAVLCNLYVLGPFFMDDISTDNIGQSLTKMGLSHSLHRETMQFLKQLPVISLNRIFEYAIMMYYCITGNKITASDLRYGESKRIVSKEAAPNTVDSHGTYKMEQELLRMVREGDIVNYRAHMNKLSVSGRQGKMSNGDQMRQIKNGILSLIVQVSRASIEGGLSPEAAYTLSDYYFQSVEACSQISELAGISHTMREDFIQRVHQCRMRGYTASIQTCLDYIDLHLDAELSLPILAKVSGYTEYYLSRKFKQEIGLAPSEYIRQQRLSRAAFWLRTTKEEVQAISDKLQFCSQSYFAEVFKQEYHMTPSEYSRRHAERK